MRYQNGSSNIAKHISYRQTLNSNVLILFLTGLALISKSLKKDHNKVY